MAEVPTLFIKSLVAKAPVENGRLGIVGLRNQLSEEFHLAVPPENMSPLIETLLELQHQMLEARRKAGLASGPQTISARKIVTVESEVDKQRGDLMLHLTLDQNHRVTFGMSPAVVDQILEVLEAGKAQLPKESPRAN